MCGSDRVADSHRLQAEVLRTRTVAAIELSLPHFLCCDAMFQAIQLRFPNFPWMFGNPNVRILHLFAVGAAEEVVLLSALLVDAVWAAFIACKRSGTLGHGPFLARLDAMATLSPRAAAILTSYSVTPPAM